MTRLLSLLVSGALAMTGVAVPGPDAPRGEGWQKGNRAGITLRDSDIILSGDVNGKRGNGYQLKQACWYEPRDDAEGMLRKQRDLSPFLHADPKDKEDFNQFLKQFQDKVGKDGKWWTPAYDRNAPGIMACLGTLQPFVFVPANETPPSGITIQQLADIARAALTVPEPKIVLNPDAKSYVNLGTFVSLDGIGEPIRRATATLPGVMSATVVARPSDKGMKIEPGTTGDRAEVVTTECGTIGQKYTKGAQLGCGVRYKRASVDQPREVYVLSVTMQWEVEVEEEEPGPVPIAEYEPIEITVTRDVPVGEVQSTVERSGT
ncbi:hypothetical protein [Streptosporangium sp. KLBMP 9127]|nr:hypothetical protein [Streptosporangium sp. KLBMP 9127]